MRRPDVRCQPSHTETTSAEPEPSRPECSSASGAPFYLPIWFYLPLSAPATSGAILGRVAELNRHITRIYAFYTIAGVLSVVCSPPGGYVPEHSGRSASLWTLGLPPFKAAFFSMSVVHHCLNQTLFLNLSASAAAILHCISRGLEEEPVTTRWTLEHSAAIRACLEFEYAVRKSAIFTAPAYFGAPIFGTVSMVRSRDLDPFGMMATSVVFLAFYPMCEVGEAVQSARQALSGSVYRGPWLEAAMPRRRDLLMLMTSAVGSGGLFRCRGIGTLNRRFFFRTIRAWFNLLQTVLNIT